MKKGVFIFMVTAGVLLSPLAFSQTEDSSSSDSLEAFLNEEEEREANQTPQEQFQEYVDSIVLERQAFQQALFSMQQFLQNIEDNKVRRSDVNQLKEQLEEASNILSENGFALFEKEDGIFESLEQCLKTSPAQ